MQLRFTTRKHSSNKSFDDFRLNYIPRLKAFTLAEVLITLAIIGVVAAATIPSIMQSTQNAEIKTALKKTMSTLSQASISLAQENGGSLKGVFTDVDVAKNSYLNYLKYSKQCDSGGGAAFSAQGGTDKCWHYYVGNINLDGSSSHWEWFSSVWPSGTILNDGTLIIFGNSSSNCNIDTQVEASGELFCLEVAADINGYKGPNIMGKDVFYFHVLENGLVKPFGYKKSPNSCIVASSGNGLFCTAYYLYN